MFVANIDSFLARLVEESPLKIVDELSDNEATRRQLGHVYVEMRREVPDLNSWLSDGKGHVDRIVGKSKPLQAVGLKDDSQGESRSVPQKDGNTLQIRVPSTPFY